MGRRSKTQDVVLEPLTERAQETRRLFSYAGAWAPPPAPGELAWGARVSGGGDEGQRLIGAVLLERTGAAGMLHGPVVVEGREAEGEAGDQRREAFDPIETAAQLLAALLPQATGGGIETLFARPQGLDRLWVRFGFIPVPEVDLPAAFKGRPGTGLFAWRGGTALWSSGKPRER